MYALGHWKKQEMAHWLRNRDSIWLRKRLKTDIEIYFLSESWPRLLVGISWQNQFCRLFFHILLSFLLSKKCHNETTICTRVIVIFVNILAIHECTVFIGSKEKRKSVGVFLGMAAGWATELNFNPFLGDRFAPYFSGKVTPCIDCSS